jgi:hypothetical protein
MAWLKKKSDPISDRERVLNEEISQLEAQIKKLDSRLSRGPGQVREPANPEKNSANGVVDGDRPRPSAEKPKPAAEPIFEEVHQNRLKDRAEPASPPDHFNELGVRKYDLPGFFRRIKNHFRGPSTTNPRLVSYLAAGGIQGLRPLRYEKRVARNRFIALVVFLFLMLLGIILALRH